MTTYQYTQLPERYIRLFKIRDNHASGTPEHPAELEIEHLSIHCLDHAPRYTAISYVWGQPKNLRPIRCDGVMHINVPLNAFLCLRRLQELKHDRFVWLDSVCINQSESDEARAEMNCQVGMMGEVYRNAAQVIIHFGRHRYDDGLVEPVTDGTPEESQISTYLRSRVRMEEYFTRAWTVQEVKNAKEGCIGVILGRFLVPWKTILAIVGDSWIQLPIVAVFNSREPLGLSELLKLTESSKATKARDKIYALLGLVNRNTATENTDRYEVHYDSEWTTARVFAHYTYVLCKEAESLDILEDARQLRGHSFKDMEIYKSERDAQDVPTWAKDFTNPGLEFRIYRKVRWNTSIFCAHNEIPCSISIPNGLPLCLEVHGCKVGTILSTFNNNLTEQDSQKWRRARLLCFLDRIVEISRPFTNTLPIEDFIKAFLCTRLFAASGLESTVQRISERIANEMLHDYANISRLSEYFEQHLQDSDNESWDETNLWKQLRSGLCQGRFLITENPFIGRGLENTETGDIICVLSGGRTPFILRETGDSENSYFLVGECYVYGIMRGEWIWEKGNNIAADKFLLR